MTATQEAIACIAGGCRCFIFWVGFTFSVRKLIDTTDDKRRGRARCS